MTQPAYHPLDAKTFGQGVKHLRCQCCTAGLAFLTGALAVLYEIMLLNVEDRDFRDMLFDYRLTQAGRKTHHAYFLLADVCTTNEYQLQSYTSGPPYCPPTVQLDCSTRQAAAASFSCNEAVAILYSLAGTSSEGDAQDCSLAGRLILVMNTLDASTEAPSSIALLHQSSTARTYTIETGSQQEWQQQLGAAVKDALEGYADPWYRAPSSPLSSLLAVDGTTVSLHGSWTSGKRRNVKRFGGWDPGLWPWKLRCPDTSYPPSYYLSGSAKMGFPQFTSSNHEVAVLQLANSTFHVPKFTTTNTTLGRIIVNKLASIQLQVAMVPSGDACNCWVIDSARPSYKEAWRGPQGAASAAMPASTEQVDIVMQDVAAPGPLALPGNKGALYIYIAICMGGIWLFSLVPMPFQLFIIHTNVLRNNGLPPPFYKYMRMYRGWGAARLHGTNTVTPQIPETFSPAAPSSPLHHVTARQQDAR